MGNVSVSPYQESSRSGHLEQRLQLPITAAIEADVVTAPSDIDLDTLYRDNLVLTRQREVPIVDGSDYVGVVSIQDIQARPNAEWHTYLVRDVVDTDWPTMSVHSTLEQAIRAMEDHGVEMVVAIDDRQQFVGTVSMAGVLRLDEILDARRE
jgi:predicted transcriptional regulator